MPEGPEVYILAKAMKTIGFDAHSYGKHLFVKDWHTGEIYDISFGLMGKIRIDADKHIKKLIRKGIPSGDMKKVKSFEEGKSKLGVDWMTASKDELKLVIDGWANRKKQIGALLLDQHEICGMGVAWVSEILHVCNIRPDEKPHTFDFLGIYEIFFEALLSVRERARKDYIVSLSNPQMVIDHWFENLYAIRKMVVFKKGKEFSVSGRIFYI